MSPIAVSNNFLVALAATMQRSGTIHGNGASCAPTSAIRPAGQDLGAPSAPGIDALPLQSRPNASPFWIMLLLSVGAVEHGMIKQIAAPL